MRYAHGVVDLETFGTGYNAPIIQVGISLPDEHSNPGGEVLDLVIAYDKYDPFEADIPTINWWLDRDRTEPRSKMLSQTAWKWDYSMYRVNDFISNYKEKYNVDVVYLWSHATFDPPILINAMQKAGQEERFRSLVHYQDMRDFRTTDDLLGKAFTGYMYSEIEQRTKPLGLIHHYAPHDAIFEHHILDHTFSTFREVFEKSGLGLPTDHLHLLGESELPPE